MSLTNCGLLMCKGQDLSMQELLQEKIALMNSGKPLSSSKVPIKRCSTKIPIQREIFSFKLNEFRNYADSDKIKQNTRQKKDIQQSLQANKLQHYRSCGKISLRKSTIEPQKHIPITNSGHPKLMNPSIDMGINRIILLGASTASKSNLQHNKQSKIVFNNTNKHVVHNQADLKKNSKDYEFSSKISEQNIDQAAAKQIHSNSIGQTSQSISIAGKPSSDQSQQLSGSPSLISNNSMQTQELNVSLNPKFKQIKNCELRKFQNIKTIKTIHTTSQFRQNSPQNSAQHLQNQALEDQESFVLQIRTITERNFIKDRRKTAFFGFMGKQNQTYPFQQTKPICKQNEDKSFNKPNQNKFQKVHFFLQSRLPKEEKSHQYINSIESDESRDRQIKCHPSLYSIVQSASLGPDVIKQPPINSIKQMTFIRPHQQSSPKFRHINTIKSIGSESIYSHTSFLDLKFMQSMQSRRALLKLV